MNAYAVAGTALVLPGLAMLAPSWHRGVRDWLALDGEGL